jgi:tetratricopeptide (TPR) repeat protein
VHPKISFLTVFYFVLQLAPQQALAIEHSPQVVQAWKIAIEQKRDGDYLVAINGFTAMLKLFPAPFAGDELQYGAHLERAECYTGTSQFAKAVDDYNWCLGYKPNDEAAIFDRAEAYANWGKWREAERGYANSLALKPNDTDNRTRHAHALIKLKDYAGAIREYDTILKQTPEDDDVWRRLGDVELLQGDYKAAAASYSKAIGYDSDMGWYYHYRALAYEKLGKADLAAKDRGKAQALNFKEKPGELERN